MQEILLLALSAVLSGADDWVMICMWGNHKLEWLRQFLPYENGIPSHDTLGRVFGLLDAARFEQCFINWMRSVDGVFEGAEIHIDGKTVRGSRSDPNKAIHIVSAVVGRIDCLLGSAGILAAWRASCPRSRDRKSSIKQAHYRLGLRWLFGLDAGAVQDG